MDTTLQIFKNMVGLAVLAVLGLTVQYGMPVLLFTLTVAFVVHMYVGWMIDKVNDLVRKDEPLDVRAAIYARELNAIYSPVTALMHAVCITVSFAIVAHHAVYGVVIYGVILATSRLLKKQGADPMVRQLIRFVLFLPYAFTAGLGIVYVAAQLTYAAMGLADRQSLNRMRRV